MGCVHPKLSVSRSKDKLIPFVIVPTPEDFHTLEEVQGALREFGLERSNLIVAIDFTKSNTWTGSKSFDGRCLHDINGPPNPYQEVLRIIGQTVEALGDEQKLIPTYGFGDERTTDKSCFPFFPDRPCSGIKEVLDRYSEIVPTVELAGPTNFASVIEKSIEIVKNSKAYHVLIIVADGQVSKQHDTVKAIVQASAYPLSIIMIGVGDGPWAAMHEFDDELPRRKFENFRFVCYTELQQSIKDNPGSAQWTSARRDAWLATSMLLDVPEQFAAVKRLGLLNNNNG